MSSETGETSILPPRHPSAERLREALVRRAAATGRSQRSLERRLGWGHGSLGNLLRGRTEATLRHIDELAPVLGTSSLELLAEVYAELPAEQGRTEELPQGLLDVLAYQATALEQSCEVFQEAQALLALPSLEEIAAMRRGETPMSKAAYLLAQLQMAGISVENVASDLRTDLDYGFEPGEVTETLFNALDAAVERLTTPPAADAAVDPGRGLPTEEGAE